MPFAAILGAFLAGLAVNLFFYVGDMINLGNAGGSGFFRYGVRTLSAGASGLAFSLIAAHVAPSGKYTTAVVMTTIAGLLCLISVGAVWFDPNYGTGERIEVTLQNVVMTAGSIAGTSSIRDIFTLPRAA